MNIIDKIKTIIGGDPHAETAREANAPEDTFLGTQLATTGAVPELSSASDPRSEDVADDVPIAKPVEAERERDPEARRDNEVVRKD